VGEKVQGSLANLGVVGVGLEMVGEGGSTAEQRRQRCASKSGELGPARLGLTASLEVEEGEMGSGRGNAGAEEARRHDAKRRRRWGRRRSRGSGEVAREGCL
jgi:hypothetical protein